MNELAIIDTEAFRHIEKVAELHIKGTSPYSIARALGIKVVDAKRAITQWEEMIASDMDARDAAKDFLNRMVAHYDTLIEKSHDNLKNLEGLVYDEKISAQVNATLKNIADYEAKRVDALQKAGLYDRGDLGDELAEREEREQVILNILRNDLCHICQDVVRDKLTQLTGTVQGSVVEVHHE